MNAGVAVFFVLWVAWILVATSVLRACQCRNDPDDTLWDVVGRHLYMSATRAAATKSIQPISEPLTVRPILPTQNTSSTTEQPVCTADLREQQDYWRFGKSCRFEQEEWICRDCGTADKKIQDWKHCTRLYPNGVCAAFPGTPWDSSPRPRSSSMFDPTATHHATRQILSWYDTQELYEQVPCNVDDGFCFDLSRCLMTGPISVYAHPIFEQNHSVKESLGQQYLRRAAEMFPDKILSVESPEHACLLVVTCDAYDSFDNMAASKVWHQGQNHFVFQSNHCFEAHPGRSFQETNFGMAAIATSSLTDVMLRKNYDIPLARVRGLFHTLQKEFAVPADLPRTAALQTTRRWLLGYKGKISAHWPHPWWHHRYLAYEYWNTSDPAVVIDATCWGRITRYASKREYTANLDYNELLSNATFAFCPGGMSVNSFRFSEALGLGSIPVVTPEFLPPFSPEIDWSQCLVTVSEARIVDLPRILRLISHDEVERRQRTCLKLFNKTIGWVEHGDQMVIDSGEQAFISSMELWAHRIRRAHASRLLKSQLETRLFMPRV